MTTSRESPIFISYSRQDQGYVKNLINSFEQRGLSVWLDDRIDYGAAWQEVIEKHLRACQFFVLVMTPRSSKSHWVNCELSLALELKKPIFPLLLEGERWFGVSALQVVDVRNGAIPPERFFQAFGTGAQWSRSVDARYAGLERYLINGQWKEADNETYQLMITEVGKEVGQWFSSKDLLNLPCEPLRTIDGLWAEHSGGKFGFSVQKKMYVEECGGVANGEDDSRAFSKFYTMSGWQGSIKYDLRAPKGHLPFLVGGFVVGDQQEDLAWRFVGGLFSHPCIVEWVVIVFSRIQTCEL